MVEADLRNRFCDLHARRILRARESLQLVYGPTGIGSTGAVERVNVSLFRSSWARRY